MHRCNNKTCSIVQDSTNSMKGGAPVSDTVRAIAVLSGSAGVSGVIRFSQSLNGGPTTITGTIKGLQRGHHGFHIHEFGDLSDGCTSAGAHYNPTGKRHGDINEPDSHIGDLGNVSTHSSSTDTEVNIVADKVSLLGPFSVVGRSLVLHQDFDDLGRGQHEDSLTTGHSGSRVACGVIGIAKAY
ncbi:Cu/Zn-superoxide dismutase [Yasminevirus sp. GU-2018]|uniref:superoxide dismutase n=1 Tax=Yasminevirus sp. GU-2018 TaxID=2420051 RepID=A0A5K0UAN3_9VIRU|nr:Cu/Zn-superoxide dismutase [Yasminevirus sp. GU-2018]